MFFLWPYVVRNVFRRAKWQFGFFLALAGLAIYVICNIHNRLLTLLPEEESDKCYIIKYATFSLGSYSMFFSKYRWDVAISQKIMR